MQLNRRFFILISCLLHASLFVGILHLSHTSTTPKIHLGDHSTEITSYLKVLKVETLQKNTREKKALEEVKKTNVSSNTHKALPLKQEKELPSSVQKQDAPLQRSKAHSQGEDVRPLIRILHQKIQGMQRYPATAEMLGQEGRTTVAFLLKGSGNITELRIVKSSGVTSLDQASMRAVQDAAPFEEAKKYLKHDRQFQIDVVFEET